MSDEFNFGELNLEFLQLYDSPPRGSRQQTQEQQQSAAPCPTRTGLPSLTASPPATTTAAPTTITLPTTLSLSTVTVTPAPAVQPPPSAAPPTKPPGSGRKASNLAQRIAATDALIARNRHFEEQLRELQSSAEEIRQLYENERSQRMEYETRSQRLTEECARLDDALTNSKMQQEQVLAQLQDMRAAERPMKYEKLLVQYVRMARKLQAEHMLHWKDVAGLQRMNKYCAEQRLQITPLKSPKKVPKSGGGQKTQLNEVSPLPETKDACVALPVPQLTPPPAVVMLLSPLPATPPPPPVTSPASLFFTPPRRSSNGASLCSTSQPAPIEEAAITRPPVKLKDQATQCDAPPPPPPPVKPPTRSQGTQHISTTTTRSTSTACFIKQHHVGTSCPERAPLPACDAILQEMSKWGKFTPVSPIIDLLPPPPPPPPLRLGGGKTAGRVTRKTLMPPLTPPLPPPLLLPTTKTVGTCTLICNVQQRVDFVSPAGLANNTAPQSTPIIKRSTSRPPSRLGEYEEHIKWESSVMPASSSSSSGPDTPLNSSATQPPPPAGLPLPPPLLPSLAGHLNYTAFEELWRVFGHLLYGLLQHRGANAATQQPTALPTMAATVPPLAVPKDAFNPQQLQHLMHSFCLNAAVQTDANNESHQQEQQLPVMMPASTPSSNQGSRSASPCELNSSPMELPTSLLRPKAHKLDEGFNKTPANISQDAETPAPAQMSQNNPLGQETPTPPLPIIAACDDSAFRVHLKRPQSTNDCELNLPNWHHQELDKLDEEILRIFPETANRAEKCTALRQLLKRNERQRRKERKAAKKRRIAESLKLSAVLAFESSPLVALGLVKEDSQEAIAVRPLKAPTNDEGGEPKDTAETTNLNDSTSTDVSAFSLFGSDSDLDESEDDGLPDANATKEISNQMIESSAIQLSITPTTEEEKVPTEPVKEDCPQQAGTCIGKSPISPVLACGQSPNMINLENMDIERADTPTLVIDDAIFVAEPPSESEDIAEEALKGSKNEINSISYNSTVETLEKAKPLILPLTKMSALPGEVTAEQAINEITTVVVPSLLEPPKEAHSQAGHQMTKLDNEFKNITPVQQQKPFGSANEILNMENDELNESTISLETTTTTIATTVDSQQPTQQANRNRKRKLDTSPMLPSKRSARLLAKQQTTETTPNTVAEKIKMAPPKKQRVRSISTGRLISCSDSENGKSEESDETESRGNETAESLPDCNMGFFKDTLLSEEEISEPKAITTVAAAISDTVRPEEAREEGEKTDTISVVLSKPAKAEEELVQTLTDLSKPEYSPSLLEASPSLLEASPSGFQILSEIDPYADSPASPSSPDGATTSNDCEPPPPPCLIPLNRRQQHQQQLAHTHNNSALIDCLIANFSWEEQNFIRGLLTKQQRSQRAAREQQLNNEISRYVTTLPILNLDVAAQQFAQTLVNMCGGDTQLLCNVLVEQAKMLQRPEVELKCSIAEVPLNYVSNGLQRLCPVVQALHNQMPEQFLATFVLRLETTIFNCEAASADQRNSLDILLNLTQLYLLACCKEPDMATLAGQQHQPPPPPPHPARLFLAKYLYYHRPQLVSPVIYEILCRHPTVLPHREERSYDRSDALISVIQHTLMCCAYDMDRRDLLTKELLSKLRFEYHFEPFQPDQFEILQNLEEKLRAGRLHANLPYAFAIYCKRLPAAKVIADVLQAKLLPLANEYYGQVAHGGKPGTKPSITTTTTTEEVNAAPSGVESSNDTAPSAGESVCYDARIAALLAIISMVIKPLPLDTDVGVYLSLCSRFLCAIDRPLVQEAAVQAVLRLQRFGYVNCYRVLLNFRPDYELQAATRAALKTFVQRKPLGFWRTVKTQSSA